MASNKRKLEEDEHNNDQDERNNDQLNPVVNNEIRSRNRTDEDTGVEQQQLVPYLGSLNQPRSSSSPSFNSGLLPQQPRHGSLNQPRSSSIPAVNRAPLHKLQSRRGSLNQPRSSSIPAVNRAPLHKLQSRRGSLNQPRSRSRSKPVFNLPPLLQLLPPRSYELQQNPLSPSSRSTQEPEPELEPEPPEPDLQLTLMTSQQSSQPSWVRTLQDLLNFITAYIQNMNADELHPSELQWINSEFNLIQTKHGEFLEHMGMSLPSVPMPSIVGSHEGGGSTSSNVLLSTAQDDKNKGHSDDAKLPIVLLDQGTRSGPCSTSGNINTGDESERPVNTAAGDMLSATDADEKQGEEENADTSQDGNTRGSSSAQ